MSEWNTFHFVIDGKWFTWWLRHLWIEGSETKAIKTWCAAFPQFSTPEKLKSHFIKIVSGRQKFIGDSDTGLKMVKDGRKRWSSDRFEDGEGNEPLIDSFEDVLLLKKTRMFIEELNLREYILSRKNKSTAREDYINTWEWTDVAIENAGENRYRERVNSYWTDIRNLLRITGGELELELLPTETVPLDEGPTNKKLLEVRLNGNRDKTVGTKNPREGVNYPVDPKGRFKERYHLYYSIRERLDIVEEYFHKKYGDNFHVYDNLSLEASCGLPDTRGFSVYYDQIEEEVLDERNTGRYKLSWDKMHLSQNGVQGLTDLDKFVKQMHDESKREDIEVEDISKTKWSSGYIDPKGNFYGFHDLGHSEFAEILCKKFRLEPEEKEGSDLTFRDFEHTLDNEGWVKVSMSRFYWDDDKHKPTEEQKAAIVDYMIGKKMDKAIIGFSNFGQPATPSEAFGEDE
jgi:hypothetical protein